MNSNSSSRRKNVTPAKAGAQLKIPLFTGSSQKTFFHWTPAFAGVTAAWLTVLTGCGFHRQGMTPLPATIQVVYIETDDPYTDFQRSLKKTLTVAGAKLAARREDATAVLGISKDETGRRVLSVSASNKPREYEVYYTVTYAVSSGGRELLPPQTISRTGNYSFDEQALIAKEEEENILRQSMAREIAGIVMRQLSKL